jgi:diguanylate cyclase (GGDEF)-like protein
MVDLDHFKEVNDTFGHAEGDRVLIHFSAAVRAVLRGEDVAFRYGGEEFILLLRACDASRGVEVAQRLLKQQHAEAFTFLGGGERPITFSAGVAAAQASDNYSGDDLLSRADAALYRAKKAGRDRVIAW